MIAIIGGSGFIGTALVRVLLAQGHAVRIIDTQPSEAFAHAWVRADVRDPQALAAALEGAEVIYSLAAEHRDDVRPRSLYHDVNVRGAAHVVEAAEAHGIQRIVFTSTVAVYGAAEHELDETAPARPFNEYGRTKLKAEQVYRDWAERTADRSLTIVRPTVIFGPGNRGNVYTLLSQFARRRAAIIGNGRNRKSMAYVENVADFLAFSLSFGPGIHIYNYADKPDMDMNELAALAHRTLRPEGTRPPHIPYALALALGLGFDSVAAFTGLTFPVSRVRIRKYCANTQFANARVQASGFQPKHSLRDALLRTMREEFGPSDETAPTAAAVPAKSQS